MEGESQALKENLSAQSSTCCGKDRREQLTRKMRDVVREMVVRLCLLAVLPEDPWLVYSIHI